MKRLLNTAIGYFNAASAAGVFYREFTKWNGFTGKTTLGFVHTHLFVLGMFLFFDPCTDMQRRTRAFGIQGFQKVLYRP